MRKGIKVRMIGSMKDLNVGGTAENSVPFETLISKLEALESSDYINVSVEVDGGSPTIKPLSSITDRNGYKSKQMSFNRQFTITTRRLFNHSLYDVSLMKKLDYLHTFPHHYFTFWENVDDVLVCNHKSKFGEEYYSDAPAFVVATFEAPSIKNNNADVNSKHSAHRVYSWNATEYGVRSIKDIVGG